MAKMSEFLSRYETPSLVVNTMMDSENQKIMEDNKKVIESLLNIIILYGKQGLALHGHWDDCIHWTEDEEKCSNEGKFVELVCFCVETDQILSEHLSTLHTMQGIHPKVSKMNWWRLSICGDTLDEVMKVKYYTVIADEFADISNKEQLSLKLFFHYL